MNASDINLSAEQIFRDAAFGLIFHFVVAVLMMSLMQLGSILIWTPALYATGLIQDIRLALLFSGSCFTTLGIFAAILPKGWKSVAFYIAFSGLFSFAIATSSMMSMLGIITKKVMYARTSKTLNQKK